MGHYHHHQLVNGGAQQKGDEHRARPGQLVTPHRRRVHVSEEELVNGPVPLS